MSVASAACSAMIGHYSRENAISHACSGLEAEHLQVRQANRQTQRQGYAPSTYI